MPLLPDRPPAPDLGAGAGLALGPDAPEASWRCPRTSPPDELDRWLRERAPGVAPGESGRQAAIVLRCPSGERRAYWAFTSARPALGLLPDLAGSRGWAGLAEAELPPLSFRDGAGRPFTLRQLLSELFAEHPTRHPDRGGREQEEIRRRWRLATALSAAGPLVRLLAALNEDRRGRRAVALSEWWRGSAPGPDVRFDGCPCGPRKSDLPLLVRLLSGAEEWPVARPLWPAGQAAELPILYLDEHLVAVDKPARLPSVPGIRDEVSALSLLSEDLGELHCVHRLDADTSGILLFARHRRALAGLNLAFRQRLVSKRYRALLEGRPRAPEGLVDLPLGLNILDRPRQCVLAPAFGGRAARTRYQVIDRGVAADGLTTVDLWPLTGRTHQLRLHCAHPAGLGAPIHDDPFYSAAGREAERPERRMRLRACELRFAHPVSGAAVHLRLADEPR